MRVKYLEAMELVCTPTKYIGLLRLFGMSGALSNPIKSYCPSKFEYKVLNVTVQGHGLMMTDPEIAIMWSSSRVPDKNYAFSPHHIMVLCPLSEFGTDQRMNLSNYNSKQYHHGHHWPASNESSTAPQSPLATQFNPYVLSSTSVSEPGQSICCLPSQYMLHSNVTASTESAHEAMLSSKLLQISTDERERQ